MAQGGCLRLGLIGDNIAQSRAPLLHRLAGEQNALSVTYDRLVPPEMAQDFAQVFEGCRCGGYHGINVTYPYKEQVTAHLRVDDPLVRGMGACNTVLFEADGPRGYNTDYSGFVAAYAKERGKAETGAVLMIGSGGVGRAVAFGLAHLGTSDLRLVDRDPAKAEALAGALRAVAPKMQVSLFVDVEEAAKGAAGIVNCTPVGMVGYEGTPLPRTSLTGALWAFDAVYTPVDTQFLKEAQAEGLQTISGYDLFIYQGVHAWELFSGVSLNEAALRAALQTAESPA